ncbi:hypothetical protein [Mycolicibacterium confluentis]|uniref:Uncharacterized protein n=1 Tax=Mycolicibacterium confluentis TaxID=28047 RepID=A0A7I7XWI6_9MYCO|nr:hypothetical protein [Mycolicibacterium confluentis]MCV7321796.1 hypothetical protein [Mycolicibacterium confluentis]ORV32060.1 hypothetical protein AWB99_10365 [Mycolicibacterium confluentis]BBZ33607.1 hypothetical protein MCNF_22120 [Mycolicibacterium confluentis]
MTIIGDWDVGIRTPIGSLQILYRFTERDGAVAGSAVGDAETVPLTDIDVDGPRVTWKQTVTRPMRLKLTFDVEVHGDALTGHSRAGRLPRSAVTGVRRVRHA